MLRSSNSSRAVTGASRAARSSRSPSRVWNWTNAEWAVNAAIADGDPLARARTAVANAATRVARHPAWARERAIYHAVVGLDWLTAQPLTGAELDAAIAHELEAALDALEEARKALTAATEGSSDR